MESSHDGVAKRLNGHGPGAHAESTKALGFDPSRSQLPGLVDELAQALGMSREALNRTPAAAGLGVGLSGATPNLPVVPAPRQLFDDDDDDTQMPIPSTWRAPPEQPAAPRLSDHLRAAAMGFGTGLAVVVPVVLLLTGRLGDVSLEGFFAPAPPAIVSRQPVQSAPVSPQPPQSTPVMAHVSSPPTIPRSQAESLSGPDGREPASPSAPSVTTFPMQQRPVVTSIVVPDRTPEPAPAPISQDALRDPLRVPPATDISWGGIVADAKGLIRGGDISGARTLLGRPVAAGNPEALMALAETFDPNMLAAWGVRDVNADVAAARSLYAKALSAGMTSAHARLRALEPQ